MHRQSDCLEPLAVQKNCPRCACCVYHIRYCMCVVRVACSVNRRGRQCITICIITIAYKFMTRTQTRWVPMARHPYPQGQNGRRSWPQKIFMGHVPGSKGLHRVQTRTQRVQVSQAPDPMGPNGPRPGPTRSPFPDCLPDAPLLILHTPLQRNW